MKWTIPGLMLTLICCSKDDGGANSISGTVSLPSRGHTAAIFWDTAVGYSDGSTFIAYLTGAEGASCASIAEFLGPNDGPTPKDTVLQGGSCTLMIKIEDWTGASVESRTSGDSESFHAGLSTVLNCNFGEGETWVKEIRNEEYEDYYWSGDYFLGSPEVFSWDISGGEAGIMLQADFGQFDGNFPDETEFERHSASADIAGEMAVSWCEDLVTAEVL